MNKTPRETEMPLTNRRCHPRKIARNVKTWMLINGGKREPCTIVDVSRNGALIQSPFRMLPGMKVELAFVRPGNAKVTQLVRRLGEVVRSSRNAYAVSFVHPRPRDDASHQYRSQR